MKIARAVLFLALAACSSAQVREIVSDADVALMMQPDGSPASGDWKSVVEDIDAFIRDHPGQEVANNALRVRQGLILAVHQQDARAEQSFLQVQGKSFPTERDRALAAAGPSLAWWYKHSRDNPLPVAELQRGERAIADFDAAAAPLPAGSETRVFLAVARSMVAVKSVNDTRVNAANRERLSSLLRDSGRALHAALSAEDLDWIAGNPTGNPADPLRRRLSARSALKALKTLAAEKTLTPDWTPDWVKQRLQ